MFILVLHHSSRKISLSLKTKKTCYSLKDDTVVKEWKDFSSLNHLLSFEGAIKS